MLNQLMVVLAASEGQLSAESHVLPHYLFGSHWLTNHHVMSLAGLVLGALVLALGARQRLGSGAAAGGQQVGGYVRKGALGNLIEVICVFLRDEVTRPMLGKATDKYIYYIWSIFFFVLAGNLLGMLPVGPVLGLFVGKDYSHIGGTFTGNINFTAGLAVMSLVMIVGIGIRENGMGFFGHMWPVPLTPVYLSPVLLVIGLMIFVLELVGLGIKSFALCIRLFANMVAGHLVLGSLIIMAVTGGSYFGKGMTVLGATALSFMELFVALLQAYIFTFLTVIFISLGASHHEEHEHEDHGGHETEGSHGHGTGKEGHGALESKIAAAH